MVWRWGIAASLAWAVTGAYAGMHLAVAPATLAYEKCVQTSEQEPCLAGLRRAWPSYSDDRITYALMAALIPVSIGWIVGWALVARKDPLTDKRRKRPEVTA